MYSKDESLATTSAPSTPPPPPSQMPEILTVRSTYLAKRHICNKCKRSFKRVQHYRQHVLYECDIKSTNRFYCEICNRTFSRSDALKRHFKQIGHKTRAAVVASLKIAGGGDNVPSDASNLVLVKADSVQASSS